jgi:ankyrin repeat protein
MPLTLHASACVNTRVLRRGNTALHMCVYHNQIEMFDHLMEYCGATDNARNIEGLTPLVLAASLGYSDMFQHICNKRRKVGWSYGPVR